jgi:hypothetical protein
MVVVGGDTTPSRIIITHQLAPCYPDETTSGPMADAIQRVFARSAKRTMGVVGASLHLVGGRGHDGAPGPGSVR